MTRTRTYDQLCPVAISLDLIGDRWSLLILRDLVWRGPHGYQQLLDANPGLSPTVLAERLRNLTDEGLIERLDVRDGRRSAVYRLTDAGRRIEPVIGALYDFGGSALATTRLTSAKLAYLVDLAARAVGEAIYDLPAVIVRLTIDDLTVDISLAPGLASVVEDGIPVATVAMDQATFTSLVAGEAVAPAVEGDAHAAAALLRFLAAASG